jgi:hypothetical protein
MPHSTTGPDCTVQSASEITLLGFFLLFRKKVQNAVTFCRARCLPITTRLGRFSCGCAAACDYICGWNAPMARLCLDDGLVEGDYYWSTKLCPSRTEIGTYAAILNPTHCVHALHSKISRADGAFKKKQEQKTLLLCVGLCPQCAQHG